MLGQTGKYPEAALWHAASLSDHCRPASIRDDLELAMALKTTPAKLIGKSDGSRRLSGAAKAAWRL